MIMEHSEIKTAGRQLIVFASGSGTNFEKIAARFHVDLLLCDRREALVLERAAKRNVPSVICCKQDFPDRAAFDIELAHKINTFIHSTSQATATTQLTTKTLIILAGFMHILGHSFFKTIDKRCQLINLHPAHREDYKGAKAYEYAVAKRFPRWGLSVHVATPELDSGPLIASCEAAVYPTDTPETLHTRLQSLEHALLTNTIHSILKGHTL